MITGFAKSALIVAADLALLCALPHVIDLRVELDALRAERQVATASSSAPILSPIEASGNASQQPLLARITLPLLSQITRPLLSQIHPPLLKPITNTAPSPGNPVLTPIAQAATKDSFLAETRRRAEIDPEATMLWLQNQHTGSERLRGMLEVVALWATQDSEAALLWLESNAQGLARLETLSNGVELWAERNPTAAAEWIDGMANDGSKTTAAKTLAAKWVQTDPDAALAWVTGLANGPIRTEATLALAQSWTQTDPKAASIWALSEAEFNGNYELLSQTILQFSQQAPQDAELFVRDLADNNYASIAVSSFVTGRAQADPIRTAQWLAKLAPEDPIYSAEYANSLMQVWAESDSIAASEWLNEQPAGELRDAAAYGFSESIQAFEPEAAAAWANTIDDPDRRILRLTDSITQWARSQPHQALEWVQTAELEPAIRTHLANQIGVD